MTNTKTEPTKAIDRETVLREALRWVAGAHFQAKRLRAHLDGEGKVTQDRTAERISAVEFGKQWKELAEHEGFTVYSYEEYFLVAALGKALRWLARAVQQEPKLGPYVTAFETAIGPARDARHARAR